MEKDGL